MAFPAFRGNLRASMTCASISPRTMERLVLISGSAPSCFGRTSRFIFHNSFRELEIHGSNTCSQERVEQLLRSRGGLLRFCQFDFAEPFLQDLLALRDAELADI